MLGETPASYRVVRGLAAAVHIFVVLSTYVVGGSSVIAIRYSCLPCFFVMPCLLPG